MPDTEMTPDEFHGLKGKYKQWSSLGVIGLLSLMCVHLVVFQNPSTQATFVKAINDLHEKAAAQLKEERLLSKEEAAKSRQHGGEVTKDLSVGLVKNAEAIHALNDTFIRVQERTQANQQRMIELQIEKMKTDKGIQ